MGLYRSFDVSKEERRTFAADSSPCPMATAEELDQETIAVEDEVWFIKKGARRPGLEK